MNLNLSVEMGYFSSQGGGLRGVFPSHLTLLLLLTHIQSPHLLFVKPLQCLGISIIFKC